MKLKIFGYRLEIFKIHDHKEYMRKYTKKLHAKRKKKGLCVQCGVKVKELSPHPNSVYYRKCKEHRLKENKLKK